MIEPTGLLPFIPGGSDFNLSRQLFKAIGFVEHWENSGYAGFQCGTARFILQDYNEPGFANNLMMRLEVPDLDAWWAEIESKRLPDSFPDFSIKPPTSFPWGREVNFIDLAGVCWHVG